MGELADFEPWLGRINENIPRRKSFLSDNEVSLAVPYYDANTRFASLGEISPSTDSSPLDINEIKDMDSLTQVLQERLFYCGDIVLGNSQFVEKSSDVNDSFYVYKSDKVGDSKHIALCTMGRLNENMFGCNGMGESKFCIRCNETTYDVRCFELWRSDNCADCYYSANLSNCSDAFFSFHQKNKRFLIGNLELPREKYLALKKKLLAEIAEELRREKHLPNLLEIVSRSKPPSGLPEPALVPAKKDASKEKIEEAFSKTTELLFGRAISGLDVYGPWLGENVRELSAAQSCISGEPILIGDYGSFSLIPKDRLVKIDEGEKLGSERKMRENTLATLSFSNAHELLGDLAFFATDLDIGRNENMVDCVTMVNASHAYRSCCLVYGKYAAYSFWPRSSDYAFGCFKLFDSQFCINSYCSVRLKRCFEMDSCRDCSDSYFCHNSENVRDSFLCFNTKNKSHAIGNFNLEKEKYRQTKDALLQQLADELEKNKRLKWSVYNLRGV